MVGAPEVTGRPRRQRPDVSRARVLPRAVPSPPAPKPTAPGAAPEELLQAGVAEAVAASRHLHRLAHGLPAQWAQQPPLGLLQELVVEAGHGGLAAGTGERGRARGGPTARASLRPRSPGCGRRRLAAASGPGPQPRPPEEGAEPRPHGPRVRPRTPPTPQPHGMRSLSGLCQASKVKSASPTPGSWSFSFPLELRAWLRFFQKWRLLAL